jgi:hypothetical protein
MKEISTKIFIGLFILLIFIGINVLCQQYDLNLSEHFRGGRRYHRRYPIFRRRGYPGRFWNYLNWYPTYFNWGWPWGYYSSSGYYLY